MSEIAFAVELALANTRRLFVWNKKCRTRVSCADRLGSLGESAATRIEGRAQATQG